ncbi:MAG: porin family protein [Bacteroidales bacterium]
MKKYLIILTLIFSGIQSLYSQNMKFTVFVEPKFSWMTPDLKNVDNDGTKLGVNIGLNVDKFFAPNYAIMTGISIDNTGGFLKYDLIDGKAIKTNGGIDTIPSGSTLEYKLQYINVPFGLKLKTNEIGYFTFFTHLGINAGVNIKATGEVEGYELENDNISDEIKLFNLGYYIGLGTEYSIGGNTAIVLGITYNNGFVDITTDSNNKVTNSNLAVRVGILF